MLLEASGRYLRARNVYNLVTNASDLDIFAKFPLLKHQWQIVESFKGQISMKSRERLMDRDLMVGSYADALAAAAVIDGLDPNEVLGLFLDSRKSWIEQKMNGEVNGVDCGSVICNVVNIVKSTLGQVGELFLLALNEMPLFYKLVLGTPPGTQLFGGIPNPEEEVRLWKVHREKLESVMVMLDSEYIAKCCSEWLRECCGIIFGELSDGKRLVDSAESGDELANVEKLVRESLDGREDLESSLEQWLKNVFGSDIESPWDQIRGIILKDGKNILEERMEEAFVKRMKDVLYSRFDDLKKEVNLKGTIEAIVANSQNENDFKSYMKKRSTGGGFWFTEPNHKKMALAVGFKPTTDENDFKNCLNAYFGVEVSRIRDVVDAKCSSILEDLLVFVECYNSTLRLKELAPYLQENCCETMAKIIRELEDELGLLSSSLENRNGENIQPPSVLVERSLFIGRLLFALRNHSKQIPLILGSPRNWVKETSSVSFTNVASPFSKQTRGSFDSPIAFSPRKQAFDSPRTPRRQFIDSPRSPRRQFLDSPRRQTISAAAALYAMDGSKNPKLEELNKTLEELCIKAHNLWIIWVSNELSIILSKALHTDETLSMSTPSRGWEVTVVKQEQSSEGSTQMKIALPSMPSLYITSFLFQACLEIHKVGGHVLDKSILRNFSGKLLEKIVGIYDNFLSTIGAPDSQVSDKGILQILLDIKFSADILSGGKDNSKSSESNTNEKFSKTSKPPFRRKHVQASTNKDPTTSLIQKLSQKLDPIDWATYEPYLWENEKQSYKRFAVLFGFLVQLNRMYTETVQKLPTRSNTESNIMRCSTVPRFSYLPISAPALSSRGQHKSSLQTSAEDLSSRSSRIPYSNGDRSPKHELDDSASFVASTPLLKSFMTQVGSKFGESTSRLGSMLSDGQVGKLKDKSAAAMSTFGSILDFSTN